MPDCFDCGNPPFGGFTPRQIAGVAASVSSSPSSGTTSSSANPSASYALISSTPIRIFSISSGYGDSGPGPLTATYSGSYIMPPTPPGMFVAGVRTTIGGLLICEGSDSRDGLTDVGRMWVLPRGVQIQVASDAYITAYGNYGLETFPVPFGWAGMPSGGWNGMYVPAANIDPNAGLAFETGYGGVNYDEYGNLVTGGCAGVLSGQIGTTPGATQTFKVRLRVPGHPYRGCFAMKQTTGGRSFLTFGATPFLGNWAYPDDGSWIAPAGASYTYTYSRASSVRLSGLTVRFEFLYCNIGPAAEEPDSAHVPITDVFADVMVVAYLTKPNGGRRGLWIATQKSLDKNVGTGGGSTGGWTRYKLQDVPDDAVIGGGFLPGGRYWVTWNAGGANRVRTNDRFAAQGAWSAEQSLSGNGGAVSVGRSMLQHYRFRTEG